MLRITNTNNESVGTTILRVEGRLVAEWVDLFESECREVLGQGQHLTIDLSGVMGADERARDVLRQLAVSEVELINQPGLLGLEEIE